MDQPTVISIDPGTKTRGAISQEGRFYDSLSPRIVATIGTAPEAKETINFLTGINGKKVTGVSGKLFFLRLLSSIGLGYASYLALMASDMNMCIVLCVMAVSLLFGFMTRIICTAAISAYGVLAMMGVIGAMDNLIFAIPALIFMIMGPGIFSVDQLARRALFKRLKSNHRRRSQKGRFNYRAYSTIDRM